MADEGHVLTDKLLKKLEKDVASEYRTATREMQAKLTAYLEKTEAQRQVQEGLLNAGKITEKEYKNWCYRHTMVGKRWKEMCETLAQDMHNANQIALGMTKDKMPDVYALNANYATYQIETGGRIDTGFTLYNHDTAEYLLGDQRQLMPKPSSRKAAQIAANKDMQWNMRKIQSAVLQGVLQGESPYKVAERLQQVGQMNCNSAVRYARTMTTSAQNAGRYEAYRRADKLGVDLVIEWQATLDDRTRHDHRLMHGQRTDVDKPFRTPDGFTIYYPADCTGDSDAPQSEIWNCRCTLLSWVKGFEGDTVKESDKMDGMSFEEWQDGGNKPSQSIPRSVYDSVNFENAADDWFEYEKANYMREYIRTGTMATKDMYGDFVPVHERQQLAAEAELIQSNGEKTKTKYNTVYRGMVLEEDDARKLFTPGETYTFDTLSATATDKNIAQIYMNPDNVGGGVPVILEIQKSDGIYGFDRDGIEVVLPKGSEFRVTRNYMDRDGVVHVSLYSKKGKNVNGS